MKKFLALMAIAIFGAFSSASANEDLQGYKELVKATKDK